MFDIYAICIALSVEQLSWLEDVFDFGTALKKKVWGYSQTSPPHSAENEYTIGVPTNSSIKMSIG